MTEYYCFAVFEIVRSMLCAYIVEKKIFVLTLYILFICYTNVFHINEEEEETTKKQFNRFTMVERVNNFE